VRDGSTVLRHTVAVELIVVLPIALMPLVAMAEGRRWSLGGVALWLASLGFLVLWAVTAWRAFDRADAGLEAGSILAGGEWVLAALAAAACSVLVTWRRRPTCRPRRAGTPRT
jgi:apolipoprotein N-acyltransferase